ncbi:MFS transporter, partial [Salmonella enterica subsp. enterica serovar London]
DRSDQHEQDERNGDEEDPSPTEILGDDSREHEPQHKTAARTRALSVWAAVASCGLVLGFVLSGIITEYLGWRWIFLIAVPF